MARFDRRSAGKVFDTLVKLPELQRLCYSESLQTIAQQLLGTNFVLASPTQMNLRSDHPHEELHLYPWHTDYAYNFSSINSLVFWIPLQEVNEINGALHVIPGSHKFSHQVAFDYNAINAKRSANYFEILDVDSLVRQKGEIRCPLRLGECLVFHSKLIHKSGINMSNDIRYAVQSRWFDANAEDAISHHFLGGIDEGIDPASYLLNNGDFDVK